jgi:hypothetical protein
MKECREFSEMLTEVTTFVHFGASWECLLPYEKDNIRKLALTRFEDQKRMQQLARDKRLEDHHREVVARGARALTELPKVLKKDSSLGNFVSPFALKTVKQLVQPLSDDTSLPELQDLEEFWRDCEQVLETVDPDIELDQLSPKAVRALGPLLLGRAAWKLVEPEEPASWEEFK